MPRQSYQRGSLEIRKRAKSPNVWILRYREGGRQTSTRLGTVKELPTRAAAERKADEFRADIQQSGTSMNMRAAIKRYLAEKQARPYTIKSSRYLLQKFEEDWGSQCADYIDRHKEDLERWINGLKKLSGDSFSKRSKRHVKAELHSLFQRLRLWSAISSSTNPIALIKIYGEPRKVKTQPILTVEQFEKIVAALPLNVATMSILCMNLGLRISEVLALKWEDVDFVKKEVYIRRSAVVGIVSDTKTLNSERKLPLLPAVADALKVWKKNSAPKNGWVFESIRTGHVMHRNALQTKYLRPLAEKATKTEHADGLKNVGWHTFRHSFRSFMRDLGIPLEIQQKIMGHSDIRTTMIYGGNDIKAMREHMGTVVDMVMRRKA